ncbi:MAG: DUF4810 domain-containing protein [Burkholderiales bacterium]
MKFGHTAAALLAGVLVSACAPPQKYNWGGYEPALYSYYKDPTRAAQLAVVLDRVILASEQTKRPIPPGMYAEYGYLLYQQGKNAEAVTFFQKEKALWPESAYFMDTMIRTASAAANKKAEAEQK